MCTKYKVCGNKHKAKWKVSKLKRNNLGQFIRDKTLTKYFFGIVFFGAVSMIGLNTIENWFGVSLDVENTRAIEVISPTWQDEVKAMIRNAGLDVDLATRIIQHESWWDPSNTHINKDGSKDRGLWMISEVWHPEVSDECSYDAICATIQAIRIVKSRGWNEWIAYKHGYVR